MTCFHGVSNEMEARERLEIKMVRNLEYLDGKYLDISLWHDISVHGIRFQTDLNINWSPNGNQAVWRRCPYQAWLPRR